MPNWNQEMLQHISEKQAQEVAETLKRLFAAHPEIEVTCKENATPDTENRTFIIRYGVALWKDGMYVCGFSHPNDLERFFDVIRIASGQDAKISSQE